MTLAQRTGDALFWNGASLLATRIISLVRFVIVARLLTPLDFGLLAIAWVAIELLLVFSDTGMLTALLQRRHVEERDFNTAWSVGLLRGLLVGIVLLVGAPAIAALYDEPRAAPVLQALAVAPLLSAAASIKIVDLTRRFAFRRLTVIRLGDAGTEAVVSIVLASFLGVWALVVGVLVANLVRLVLSYALAPHRPVFMLDSRSARALLRFGRWMFLTGVFAVVGDALLRAVVSRQLGTAELGVFYLSLRLVLLPITSVEGAVSAIGMRAHAELGDESGRRARALQTSLFGLLALLVPAYGVLVVLADTLVSVLGTQWSSAANPIRVLSVAAVFATIAVACAPMLLGLNRPDVVAGLTGSRTVLISAGGLLLATYWGLVGATLAYLAGEIVVGLAWLLLTRRFLRRPMVRLPAQLFTVVAATAVAAAVATAADHILSGVAALLASGICGMSLAVLVLVVLDRRFTTGLVQAFGRLFPNAVAHMTSVRSARWKGSPGGWG
jgi:O-antigen/teichoic acid export membrane protein